MSELSLNPAAAGASAGGVKRAAVPPLQVPVRRPEEPRPRRRAGLLQLAPVNDGGFRLFRVY